jgi:hypothetical protein
MRKRSEPGNLKHALRRHPAALIFAGPSGEKPMTMPLPRRALRALTIPCALVAGTAALASPAVPIDRLVPHIAVYDLSLVQARDRAGIRTINGRLVYEFARRDCRAVLTYRQVMSMRTGEGQGTSLDFRSVTNEADTAQSFDFEANSVVSGTDATEVDGVAKRGNRGLIKVELQKPEQKSADLPAETMFPTEHLRHILGAAETGAFTLQADVFDGGEPGDTPSPSVTFIGQPKAPGSAGGVSLAPELGMDKLRRWPVSISYFDAASTESEQTPKFIFAADLYENGIAGALRLDYGNFVVEGRLVSLKALPAGECKQP